MKSKRLLAALCAALMLAGCAGSDSSSKAESTASGSDASSAASSEAAVKDESDASQASDSKAEESKSSDSNEQQAFNENSSEVVFSAAGGIYKDKQSVELQAKIAEKGVVEAYKEISGVEDEAVLAQVKAAYDSFAK